MRCHICGDPATGQCQTCWKFYCGSHGDVVCENCQRTQEKSRFGIPVFNLASDADIGDEPLSSLPPGYMHKKVLRGVLAVADVRRTDRAEISLLSLESYEDGFIIPYRITSTSEPPKDRSALSFGGLHPSLLFGSVKDDLGGEYRGGFGGGGGGGNDWQGQVSFTPPIADGAAELEIRIEEIQWMSMMPGQRSYAEAGPWIFTISLANMLGVSPAP